MSYFILQKFTLLIFIISVSWAEKSDFELELEHYSERKTKESYVNIDGSIYRKIEIEGNLYYLRLMRPENPVLSSDLLCNGQTPITTERPFHLEAGIKVTKRSKLFIEGLKVSCNGKLSPEIRVGFTIPDLFLSKLKNKKLFFNPFSGLVQFYGEF